MSINLFFQYSPYGSSNIYLLGFDQTKEAVLVDPAEFTVNLLQYIEKNNYYIKYIFITHNHSHHARAVSTIMKIYKAKIFAGTASISTFPSTVVRDGSKFELCGNTDVEAFSVPGHSSDSFIFKIGKFIFTGDTLQAGLISSTLSKYGDALLRRSIIQKILVYSDDTVILPGHGPPTTVGAERQFNFDLVKQTGKFSS